ncbi:MAG: ATP-dependent helicase, partial [Anaerolineae bacterium]|nr:ATP-dependent helicase [Anaerolineae bacterium]
MTNFQHHLQIITQRMLSLEWLWELSRFQPNPAQREAILHTDGPLYLTAGPGSGKTRVLLWRALNLIVFHNVPPGEIFLATFTEKAALQLKEGLQALLGLVTNLNGQPYDLTQMYIGTVHSLCRRLLTDRRRFAFDRHRNRPPVLMDELQQYFHLAKNRVWAMVTQAAGFGEEPNAGVNALFGVNSQSKYVAVTNCLALFNRFSEECVDPARALQRLDEGNAGILAYLSANQLAPEQTGTLLRLYAAYQETLVGETDFALLQQAAYRSLEAVPGSEMAFRHVIVDEYQDTNTIQERLFFKLAGGSHNLCVVGDDDQALYRFRGATVENFVEFPERCGAYLGRAPHRIALATNYRSRQDIVTFYTDFMTHTDWARGDGQPGFYRVMDKALQAHRHDPLPAVVASTPAAPEAMCAEIAHLVGRLLESGKVQDPNQIAFLFPSMKYRGNMTKPVQRMKGALEAEGLRVYAPRAGRFLDVDEVYDVFGLLVQIFGRPPRGDYPGQDYANYHEWLTQIEQTGATLMRDDSLLQQYVRDRRLELVRVAHDYQALVQVAERQRWDLAAPYRPDVMKRALHNAP